MRPRPRCGHGGPYADDGDHGSLRMDCRVSAVRFSPSLSAVEDPVAGPPSGLCEEVGANISALPSCSEMAVHTPPPSASDRTRALLEEIAGGRRGVQLRSQVAAANRGSTPEQVEEAFQEACLRATRSCRGQTVGEVYVWLRKATGTLLRDARERLKREVLFDQGAAAFQVEDTDATRPDEEVIRREQHAELDALTTTILDRLCERERMIAVLHSHGYARKEIAERLGLTPRIVKRSVEEVLATGRSQLAKFTGYGCPDGHQLVSRYAFGLLAGGDAGKAQLHLATCQRCGAMYERLDVWRERVAATLPVPPVAVEYHETFSRLVHTGADAVASSEGRHGVRRQVADTAGHVRDHLTSAYLRVTDPTPLAGVRPGAMAAAVVGCIAVGSGATYCVQQNAPSLIGLSDKPAERQPRTQSQDRSRRPESTVRKFGVARLATTTTATAPAASTTPHKAPAKAKTRSTAPKRDSLSPAPEDEFEPTAPAGTSAAAEPAASVASSGTGVPVTSGASEPAQEPAAAPASEPSEFEGP